MFRTAKIAYRNLLRYTRRTILTSTLVTIGIVAVLVFVAIAGSFKQLMIGQITDSMLGHLQIHRKGYVASIDNSPLILNLNARQMGKIQSLLNGNQDLEGYSSRLRFGGMLSNFAESTNIRLIGIHPDAELITVPLLRHRVTGAGEMTPSLKQGEIWVPKNLAMGMKLKHDDQVVLVATNKQGSVNAFPFIVKGIVNTVGGPGGRDGYLNIEDAYRLLRIEPGEANEIALRVKNFSTLESVYKMIANKLKPIRNKKDKPVFEVHSWKKLTPFATIANIIDLLTVFVKIIMMAIVLVSIMNVMLMAVYERIREIGTIAAIGTGPGQIWSLFLMEGLFLGIFGAMSGSLISLAIIKYFQFRPISLAFGRTTQLISPGITASQVLGTALMVILISSLASLQPAVKASKLEPVEALRHY
jgi:putative ABC transport system permease protein